MWSHIRRRQSPIIAAVMALVLTAWLASGPEVEAPASPAAAASARTGPFRVRVDTLAAREIAREIVVYGRTEPSRSVTLRAEIDGRIVELGAQRGRPVASGAVLVALDPRDREARLTEARALVKLREIQFAGASKLSEQNFQSEAAVAEAAANLAAARTAVARVQVELANTRVRAPFDGILDRRPVEVGDFVREGNEVARVLDTDPIIVVGFVTQQELRYLEPRARGEATLLTGETVAGALRYIAAESDEATRTFRIELEVPNPDGRLAAGITTELRIATESRRAHRVSPALLGLDGSERVGIKAVDDAGRVVFHPVEIVRADGDGIWVSGLPDPVRVIVVGQGFVRAGEQVEASEREAPAHRARAPANLRPTQTAKLRETRP